MKTKMIVFIAVLVTFISASSYAQNKFDDQERFVRQITQGIQKLKIDGAPGLLTVTGEKAFTILTDARGRSMVAGATYGKGRIAAITHGSWFDEKIMANHENNEFLGNLFSWTANSKESIKVLSRGINLKGSFNGIQILQLKKVDQLPADLTPYDLILIDFTNKGAETFNSDVIASLKEYVANGGGVICSALGWVYNNYGDGKKGKSLEKDFVGNIFLKNFGMIFNGDFTGNEIQLSKSIGNKNHPLLLIETVSDIVATKARISENELNNLLTSMLSYKNRMPYNEKYLSKFETYYDSFGRRREISAGNPVLKTETGFLLTIGMLNLLYQSAPYDRISKLKDAANFPGEVGPSAASVEKDFQFDSSKLRWQSTGLYMPAGRPVSFTIASNHANLVKLRVGAHSDILIPMDNDYRKQLNRGPDISMTKVLNGGETLITSPYGGLIYFEKIGKPENTVVNIRINGAAQAPYFKLGETNAREWRDKIRYYSGPWGEMAGNKIILTLPAATLKKVENPETILKYWDRVLSYYPQLLQEPPRDYEERFVTDVQPKVGYMHSGYPIMIRIDVSDFTAGVAFNPVDRTDIYKVGSWGHFHELGHNCQKDAWTFEGTTEVTVNLFTLYAMEHVHGIRPAQHPWIKEGLPALKKHIAKGSPFEEWKKDPRLGLITYILLQQEFGWEAYQKVFTAYQKLDAHEKPKNDQEKRDLWVIMFSNVVKRDLGPYYTKIGIPVSASALKQVKKYPRWMPDSL